MDTQLFMLGFLAGALITGIIFAILQKKIFNQSQDRFEVLAQKILDEKSNHLVQNSEYSLDKVLAPLKEKISDFEKKVTETYSEEARERFALKNEIEKITQANIQMGEDAKNLTLALKGDSKFAGNWGEVVLERLLEASGLRQGHEFVSQSKKLKLESEEGKTYKPDVVVLLPRDGHIVLDSKVSLKSYEAYSSSPEELREKELKDFKISINRHIDDLSSKAYQKLEGLNTPDFVIMFIPVEGAYQLALQEDIRLFEYAWKKNIVFAGPSTLYVMLKTINSLWNMERQGKNAQDIARKSGLLYDKFVGLYEDLQKVGDQFFKTQTTFQKAMNKLHQGRGSLISKVEELRELGASNQKELPKEAAELLNDENEVNH